MTKVPAPAAALSAASPTPAQASKAVTSTPLRVVEMLQQYLTYEDILKTSIKKDSTES